MAEIPFITPTESTCGSSGFYTGNLVIPATTYKYFTLPASELDFSGFASMQIEPTAGAVTVQLEINLTDNESLWRIPYDAAINVAHPALCTALSTGKIFESVAIPVCKRARWKVTAGADAVTGSMIVFITRGAL
jgi:hypothetical protein